MVNWNHAECIDIKIDQSLATRGTEQKSASELSHSGLPSPQIRYLRLQSLLASRGKAIVTHDWRDKFQLPSDAILHQEESPAGAMYYEMTSRIRKTHACRMAITQQLMSDNAQALMHNM